MPAYAPAGILRGSLPPVCLGSRSDHYCILIILQPGTRAPVMNA